MNGITATKKIPVEQNDGVVKGDTEGFGLPGWVYVSPHRYSVLSDGDTSQRMRELAQRGEHSSAMLEIRIDGEQVADVVRETLVHELLHALWHTAGLAESIEAEDPEEFVVNALSPRLLALVRDNPDLVLYLMGDE